MRMALRVTFLNAAGSMPGPKNWTASQGVKYSNAPSKGSDSFMVKKQP